MSGKIKKSKIETIDMQEIRFVKVTDDWHPCFEDNTIGVSLHLYKSGKEYPVIFSAHGGDDFGVCMRFNSTSCEQSHSIFKLWKTVIFDRIPDGVNVAWFYEHGFYRD